MNIKILRKLVLLRRWIRTTKLKYKMTFELEGDDFYSSRYTRLEISYRCYVIAQSGVINCSLLPALDELIEDCIRQVRTFHSHMSELDECMKIIDKIEERNKNES